MKIKRKIDKQHRVILNKDILSQTNIKDEVEIDIININGEKAIILTAPSSNFTRKVLKG